jgi:hypothetical protein
LRNKLVWYNKEDCYALLKIKNAIYSIVEMGDATNSQTSGCDIVNQKSCAEKPKLSFQEKNYALPEMELINKCSYFDYQRERVHIRSDEYIKKSKKKNLKRKKHNRKINKTVIIPADRCTKCGCDNIETTQMSASKMITDLNFFESGVKRWVVKYIAHKYRCIECNFAFLPKEYININKGFGHGIKSFAMFQYVINNRSFRQIKLNFLELFGIHIGTTTTHDFKVYMCSYYRSTYNKLLENILDSRVIYVGETPFNLRSGEIYAWVFTNGEEVVSMYRETREGGFLSDLLKNFNGVLVSDFFPAYYSIDCAQQKCLIHLMRDLNDDLLKNPFDKEFKYLTRRFTIILQNIIKTIDKYGLKKVHLNRHNAEVDKFFAEIIDKKYTSEVSKQYQKRFERNKDTLFTFLNYDNVAWNNTYAEHAIKLLATHRNRNIEFLGRSRMDEHLRIMSLYQTCSYKEISFLKFLLSKEIDIDEYCRKNRG